MCVHAQLDSREKLALGLASQDSHATWNNNHTTGTWKPYFTRLFAICVQPYPDVLEKKPTITYLSIDQIRSWFMVIPYEAYTGLKPFPGASTQYHF